MFFFLSFEFEYFKFLYFSLIFANQGVSATISSQQFHRVNQYPIRAERFVVEMVPVIQSSEDTDSNPMTLTNSTVAISHPEYQSQTQNIRVFKTEPRVDSSDIPPEVVEMALDNMNRLDTVSYIMYFIIFLFS